MKQLVLFINQETSRLFRTRRGLVVLILFVVLWVWMMQSPVHWLYKKSLGVPSLENLRGEFLAPEFEGVSRWPSLITACIWFVGLYCFPIVPLFLCTDILVSDLQRGTVRFFALRSTRRDLILGRFIGQIINLVIFVIIGMGITYFYLKTWGFYDPGRELFALTFSAMNFILLALPILGLITLVSTFATTPRRVMVWTLLFWSIGTALLGWLSSLHPGLDWLTMFIPSAHVPVLMTQYGFSTLQMAYVPLLQTAVFLVLAVFILNREDL